MQAQTIPSYQPVKSMAAAAIAEHNKQISEDAEKKAKFLELVEENPQYLFGAEEINYFLNRYEKAKMPELITQAKLEEDPFLRRAKRMYGRCWRAYEIFAKDVPALISAYAKNFGGLHEDKYYARAYDVFDSILSWTPPLAKGSKTWR